MRAGETLAVPEFSNDVMPVLSKAGCNAGTCHGNLNGKGGFKLSLRGQDPKMISRSLVLAARGRRVNVNVPEQSLFLLKAQRRRRTTEAVFGLTTEFTEYHAADAVACGRRDRVHPPHAPN